jgi:alanyl-tRNA synthetase
MQAATSNDAMKYVIASQKNILDTIEVIKAKAEDTINKPSKEGIELKFNYNEKEIDVEGYRYVLALKERLQAIQNASKELEKEYMQKKSSQALKGLDQFDSLIESNKLLVKVDTTDINVIKDMASALKNNKGLDYVLLASVNGEKVTFVCAAKEPFNASLIVKEATKITGGGGGGKPDMAQAGGKDSSKVLEALAHVKEVF